MITINAIMKVNPAQRENYLELVKPLVVILNSFPIAMITNFINLFYQLTVVYQEKQRTT